MSRSTRARWWHAAGWSAIALLVSTELVILGQAVLAAPALLLLLLAAYLCSPLNPRSRTGHWAAQRRHVRHGTVVVYTRPGCVFCIRLRLVLWRARFGPEYVDWVDIWDDPEGAAYVRDLNGGSESVPTVIVPDGSVRTNPGPAQVVAALAAVSAAPRRSRPLGGRIRSGVFRGPRGGKGAA